MQHFYELEWAGADRVGAHVLGGDVARIDRRITRGEHDEKRGLRSVQNECRRVVAVDLHLLEVVPPNRARIFAELITSLTGQLVPGALDVLGRERLTVVPSDTLAQLEGQLGVG